MLSKNAIVSFRGPPIPACCSRRSILVVSFIRWLLALDRMRREFGLASMLSEWSLGPLMLATAKREERRLAEGITNEPKTIGERTNWVGYADSAVLPEII